MKFKKFGKLPGRPSALIELALKDIEQVVKKKRYGIDMGRWFHRTNQGERCTVCLAGAVMVNSLGCTPLRGDFNITPLSYGEERAALYALNSFGCGEIESGLSYMGMELPKDVKCQYPVTHFFSSTSNVVMGGRKNKQQWIADLREMVKYLKKHGL